MSEQVLMPFATKVSVVIPTYRRLDLLERALRSVLLQEYSSFEVLVVDDNGRGHANQLSVEALIAKTNDARVHYLVNEKSLGGGGARNVGIQHAQGEYIAFLDDDEDWLAGKLAKQVEMLDQAAKDVAVVDTGFFDTKNLSAPKITLPQMSGDILSDLLGKGDRRAPKLSTMLCRRDALLDVGLFDVSLPARQDLDLYIRLARKYKFISISEPLANKRHDADSRISTNPNNRIKGYELLYKKILPDLEKHPKWHAQYILNYADLLVRGGRYQDAAVAYLQSIKIMPWHPRLVFQALSSYIKIKLK